MAGLGKINTDYKREGDLKETTTRITTCQPYDSPAWRVPESHKEARAWPLKPSDLKIYKPPETSSKRLEAIPAAKKGAQIPSDYHYSKSGSRFFVKANCLSSPSTAVTLYWIEK